MITEYKSSFYSEPIIVENLDGEVSVNVLDNLNRESIYSWYNLNTKSTESDYINKWILWGLMQESINKILVLGWGGWAYIKYIEDHFIYSEITAVDIDPAMIKIAKEQMQIETDNLVTWDVVQFTDKLAKKWEKFDLILFDIYGSTGEIPLHIVKEKLFKNLKKLLYPSGIFSINYANFFLKSHDLIDQERKTKYIAFYRKIVDIYWENFITFLSPDSEGGNVSVSYNLDKSYTMTDIKKEYFKKVEFEDIEADENLIKDIKLDDKRRFLR